MASNLAAAQATKKADKAAPAAKQAAAAPATAAASAAEPASVEAAAAVLDLRQFPVMERARLGSMRTLAMLMYEAPGKPQAAYDFQRRELKKRGFTELPEGYQSEMSCSGGFTKQGFHVVVSTSPATSDPQQAGQSSVTILNNGNVAPEKLPVPPGSTPFHPRPFDAAYLTELSVADAAAACRQLILAAGWEPYGRSGLDVKESNSSMEYFKRNAIQVQCWVSMAPAAGNKALIRYDTELFQADLPAPPDIPDPRYTDSQKTLRFDAPQDQAEKIIAFYQERLPKQGWQATTEKPISDDRTRSQFLIFRNTRKDLLALDLVRFTGIVRVSLRHQTEAEVEAEEQRAKAAAEKARLAEQKRNQTHKVAVILPAEAGPVEKTDANLFEYTLSTGSGPVALTFHRDHFRQAGWTEEPGTQLQKNNGNLDLKKEDLSLSFSYFDVGFGNVEIRVSAPKNVILEPSPAKDKSLGAAAKPAEAKSTGIPGLPSLPAGLDLPADVEALLKKALPEPGKAAPGPGKKTSPKKSVP